jgi:hypothetical protein
MIGYRQLSHFSMKNKALLEISNNAGCYHCCKIFTKNEIKEYTDEGQTVLCPHCSVDSVVGDASGYNISEENLKLAHKYWF